MPKLQSIKKLHPTLVPPRGAKPHGVTPDGKQLYREIRRMAVTEWATDEEGKQKWKKNQMTGEPLVPVRRVKEIEERELIYYLESQGNGNVSRIYWKPPTPEQQAAALRKQRIAEVQDDLAAALVDAKVDPAELIASLKRGQVDRFDELKASEPPPAPDQAPAPAEDPAEREYPYMSSPGRWTLSNGDVIRGNKEKALEAEAEVSDEEKELAAQSRADAQASPEI